MSSQSHALYYHNLRDVKFPIEFQHILHATKLRYRCSSSASNSSTHANNSNSGNTSVSPSRVTSNNELHDDFYRVRSFNSSSRHDDYDQDEYTGIYIDSDDDSNSQLISQQQYYEQQQQQLQQNQQQQSSQTETWSLVEVAPFLWFRLTILSQKSWWLCFPINRGWWLLFKYYAIPTNLKSFTLDLIAKSSFLTGAI